MYLVNKKELIRITTLTPTQYTHPLNMHSCILYRMTDNPKISCMYTLRVQTHCTSGTMDRQDDDLS